MATIIVISGQQKGEYLPLGKRTNVIGRSESVPLQILDDGVSRTHLRISYDPASEKYYAEDMGSRHGVFVSHHRIKSETVLSEGDQILIGQTTLLFTDKDFGDSESALKHYNKVGERAKTTRLE